jgi:hypothetical protein
MEANPKTTPALNRILIGGWAMYAVAFVLPMKDLDMWGYNAFWVYFEAFFEFEKEEYLSILAVNFSNVVMILSPLLLRVFSARVLGVLLLLGGLNNSRFLWETGEGLSDLTKLFPAYYVWWISFFVVSCALLTSAKSLQQSESQAGAS